MEALLNQAQADPSASGIASEALALARKIGDRRGEAGALGRMGELALKRGEIPSALNLLSQSLDLARQTEDRPTLFRALIANSRAHSELSDYGTQMELAYEALPLAESMGHPTDIADAEMTLGTGHYFTQQHDKAAEAWQKAAEIYERMGDRKKFGVVLNNLATLHHQRRDFAKAKAEFTQALAIARELENSGQEAGVLTGLANLSFELKDYRACEERHLQALRIREILDRKRDIANSAYNLAGLYSATRRWSAGRPYLDRAKALFTALRARYELAACKQLEASYAEAEGNLPAALTLERQYREDSKTMFGEDLGARLSEAEARFDVQRKQREIQLLRKDQAIRNAKAWLYLGGIVALVLLVLGILYRYRLVAAARQAIAARNRDLEVVDDIVRAVNAQDGLEALTREILDQGFAHFSLAGRMGLYLLDPSGPSFRLKAVKSRVSGEEDLLKGFAIPYAQAVDRYLRSGTELEQGIFLVVRPGPPPECGSLAALPQPQTMLTMSIVVDGTLEGLLFLDYLSDGLGALRPADVRRLARFREHAVSAVGKALSQMQLDRAMARLRTLDEQKSRFMGIVAHDLRTPLSVIGLATDRLARESDPASVKATGALISREVVAMGDLIGRFLDSVAIESGKARPEPEMLDMEPLARVVLERHMGQAHSKGMDLVLEAQEGPFPAFADPRFLSGILGNLVSNALKFAPKGTRVTVRLDRQKGHARIQVIDQGPGLTELDLQNLFRPFTKLSAKPTGGENSTGLGLSIVKHMVEASGGSIHVDSRPGAGCTFVVEIPENSGVQERANPLPEVFRGQVLVADDNTSHREVIQSLLESYGLSVVTVEDGAQALEAMEQGRFDLVILDGRMPRMDGLAAVKEIRLRESPAGPWAGERQVVVALTGMAETGDLQRLLKAGFDRVLSKPLDVPALKHMLASLLPFSLNDMEGAS